jgi:nitroreductase
MSVSTASLLFVGTVAVVRGYYLSKQDTNGSVSSETSDQRHSVLLLPPPKDTLNLLRQRRSIFTKQFTGNPVSREIIKDMLEAAQWAPSHHITEPWRFCVYETQTGREDVGRLLQILYRNSCAPEGSKSKPFSQAKYDKKLKGALLSSHIIAICVKTETKNPFVEEVCSVAMAVQNMHLIATAHGVGAYWSSGGTQSLESKVPTHLGVANPRELIDFLGFGDSEPVVCLGWLYVGDYYGSSGGTKVWPSGRRGGIDNKVVWR